MKNWLTKKYIVTHYVTVIENDSHFEQRIGNIPFRQNEGVDGNYDPIYSFSFKPVPVYNFYVGNNSEELKNKNWSVFFQGSGKLTENQSLLMSGNLGYVQADTIHLPSKEDYGYGVSATFYFVDKPYGACGVNYPVEENKSIAVPAGTLHTRYQCGEKYYIEGFGDTEFEVVDTGTFVDENEKPHFDIYVGEKEYNEFYNDPAFQSDGLEHRIAKVE